MTDAHLGPSLILILASVLAVGFFTFWRMPAAMGYLLAGLAIGPHGLGLFVAGEDTRFLAELGLVFLMFMVGLEFSLPKLLMARKDMLLAGGLQVGITLAVVAGVLLLFDFDARIAVLIGGVVAMSSTAVSLKQLAEQGEISSQHGRLALGILLFQDLATIPLLILVDAWSRTGEPDPFAAAGRIGVALLILAVVALGTRQVVQMTFSWVVKARSADLFLLTVLLVALGTGYSVQLAGLAMPIGAFVAGMVIGESSFRHRVEDDIRPFRDVLVGLFFVTVGMGIDPAALMSSPDAVLAWLVVFIAGKLLLAFLAGLSLRRPPALALRVSIVLAHGGEFGLLLLALALGTGLLSAQVGQPIMLALALSMGLAPLMIQRSAIAEQLPGSSRSRLAAAEAAVRDASGPLQQWVLLCGCGRVGRLVATALEAANQSYLAIELDLTRFNQAQRQGHHVVFGDAAHRRILDAADLRTVKLLVITFDRPSTVERIIDFVRECNAQTPCIVSASDDRDVGRLAATGATVVFPENLAAGFGLADQALLLCGMSQSEAGKIITTLRAELNPELRERVGV